MKNILLAFSLIMGLSLFAGKPDHSSFDALLQKHVNSSGKVDYQGFKSDSKELDAYLKDLNENSPSSDWSKYEKLAYYINAYNAYTIKLVLSKYPIKSVTDVKFGGKGFWDFKTVKLGGKMYTLNELENNVIRKFGDARIHFAVNCASYSCPKLLNKAFTPDNISKEMSSAAKKYINDSKHNVITADKVEISQIFDWYKDDFVSEGQTIIDYLNKYSNVEINADAEVTYKDYNWSLNKQ